jgi:myo-inositol-1(or 4)-monophosphatase
MSRFLDAAVEAAQRGGEILLRELGTLSLDDVSIKEASDFVTRVDRASEDAIISLIRERYPDHAFLAEESAPGQVDAEHLWIIDPLDGTTNYIHSYPQFSISIALRCREKIIAGLVLDPLRRELFTAERGRGARLNGRPLKVSPVAAIKDCLVATGFPFRRKELIDVYLTLFKRVFQRVSDLRRAGSAALDLAHLAAGRCDAFFELGLSPWDIAAGSLMIEEAGGLVSDFAGGRDYLATGNIVAGNPSVHGEILREVMSTFSGVVKR